MEGREDDSLAYTICLVLAASHICPEQTASKTFIWDTQELQWAVACSGMQWRPDFVSAWSGPARPV